MRRHKIVFIAADLVLRLLRSGRPLPRGLAGLPYDVRFVDCHYAYERQAFALVVEHPEFPEVPQGEPLPFIVAEAPES